MVNLRRALLAFALLLSLAGCKSPGGKAGATLTGVGVAAVFPVAMACASYDSSEGPCDSGMPAVLAALPAVAVLGGVVLWIYSEVTYDPNAPAEVDPVDTATPEPRPDPGPMIPPLHEAIAARDPLARQLTVQAHNAAFRGQCASVKSVEKRVRQLDPAYHGAVFVVDGAIAGCLR